MTYAVHGLRAELQLLAQRLHDRALVDTLTLHALIGARQQSRVELSAELQHVHNLRAGRIVDSRLTLALDTEGKLKDANHGSRLI